MHSPNAPPREFVNRKPTGRAHSETPPVVRAAAPGGSCSGSRAGSEPATSSTPRRRHPAVSIAACGHASRSRTFDHRLRVRTLRSRQTNRREHEPPSPLPTAAPQRRANIAHGVVSTGAPTPGLIWVSPPGDYAIVNSNHISDGTEVNEKASVLSHQADIVIA